MRWLLMGPAERFVSPRTRDKGQWMRENAVELRRGKAVPNSDSLLTGYIHEVLIQKYIIYNLKFKKCHSIINCALRFHEPAAQARGKTLACAAR